MPPRRFRKKNPVRKRVYKRKARIGRAPRGITPSIYKFKRVNTHTVDLNTPTGWDQFDSGDCIQKGWAFALNGIEGHTQFTNLFSQYKLTGVRLQFFPSANTLTSYNNLSNIILWTCKSRYGYQLNNVSELVQKQAAKKKLVFKDGTPVDIFIRLTQLNQVYGTATTTDYTVARPKWLSTAEVDTSHYGIDTVLQTVSGVNITTLPMTIKVFTTVYFECRGVKASSAS